MTASDTTQRGARPSEPADALALSTAQRGIWYAHQLDPGSAVYTTARTVEVPDADPDLLAAAVGTALGEAEGLHMRFTADESGEPVQVPLPPRVDVHRAEVADPDRWARADLREPLDPGTGRVLRTAVLTAGPRTVWYLCVHHIAVDAHGFSLLQQRVAAVYGALAAGEPVPPTPLRSPRVLLEQEAAYRADPAYAADREFWLARFAGAPAPVTLAGRPADPVPAPPRVGGPLPDGLGAFDGAAWPEVLVAAVAAFTARETGAAAVTLGLPTMARSGAAALRTPASTANVLPVRLTVTADETPAALVTAVVAELRALRAHQRYRAEDLRRDLGLVGPGRRLTGPLVNIKPPAPALRFGAHTVSTTYLAAGPVEDLTFTAYHTAEGPHCDLDANPALYPDPAALHERFTAFVTAFTARPHERLGARQEPTGPGTLPALFAARVAADPGRPAVTFRGRHTSYAELDRRAAQLAAVLAAEGVGRGDIVAIALHRGTELIVALLAVLRRGAAYLPLDPDYPPPRLAFMVTDARPTLLLAQRGTAVPGATPRLDTDDPAVRERCRRAAPSTVDTRPEDPAYLLYTSGSTGSPKGVLVTHHNVVRLLRTTAPLFGFGPDDVWTLFHSYAFDFSVWEIWGALSTGGRLVVVPQPVTRSPRDFRALLAEQRVTVLNQTPTAFTQLAAADAAHPGPPLALHTVIFGGEALDAGRLEGWFARHGDQKPRLVNMYGITETTVHVTAHRVRRGAPALIGVPLPDLRVYLLDERGRPAGEGELHVAGPGVSLGYRGRPAQTAERFLPDPCGPPGSRMYASGDLARWTPGGELEYLGRADEQVSLRGYRIEPAEITAAALRLPGIADAAVLLDERPGGERRLLCYVVLANTALEPVAVRTALAAKLPEYLVPAAVLVVDRLPLTANGKLDRAALPLPGTDAPAVGAATSPAEQVLCGLFAEVLGVPAAGPDAHFFELGGHSVLAGRLIARVRAVLGAELDIRAVFTEPTPARLAGLLERSTRPALRHRPATGEPSSAQRRLWFLDRMEGPGPTYNLPLAVHLHGPLDTAALRRALTDVAVRQHSLRSVFPARGGTPRHTVLDDVTVKLSTVDTDEELTAAARRGFDLAGEIPLRAVLLRRGAGEHTLLLCLHHIAGDDQSLHPLAADLRTAYLARAAGRAPDWVPLPVQYADYTAWQDALLETVAPRQLDHWTTVLRGLPDRIDLPTDRPRPAVPSFAGDRVALRIDPDLHAAVRTLAARHGVSVFMVLHAALATVAHRLGAGTDIPIGTPVAGRTDDALRDLVGFFVNTLVLRTDLTGDPSFAALLARVRETDLAAYANQDLPFDRLVEALNPARRPDRHPLFQVMLTLGTPHPRGTWGEGLTARLSPVHTGTEKFDLTVNLTEHPAGGGIDGFVEYATDLFDAATARALGERLLRVLRAATADPDRPIGELPILGAAERATIVHEWNATTAPIAPLSLPEMVARQAAATPDAVAVHDAGLSLSYAELDRRANRLAGHLRALGVGPEHTVGIHTPRSADQVVGLLATLKAGGAFVPLDPDWPPARITAIAASARLSAVLTRADVAADLPALPMPVVAVDDPALDRYPAEGLAPTVGGADLAYVIYTSGSTGAPKGAMIRHRAISNRLPWQVDLLGLTPDDAVLYKAPLTFDISVNEIFLPLVSGARLVVAAPGGEKDTGYLLDLVRAQRVTFVYLVSTMLELMLERDDVTAATRSLRHVWCGGEVLTPQLYQRFRARMDATMYHGYGPAEATIGVSCQVYRGQDPAHGITIGRPNPNNQVYVLDGWMEPVPVGVPGELYIGGVQVARGYLGDPERTAERFLPDPFSGRSGARLYATGDLARWRRDGQIEFLGRVDNQVKIGGMRLELEEVEAALAAHPAVRQAVVVVRRDGPLPRLAAFCVPDGDAGAATELRTWLATRLPEYMVPAEYTVLTAFPLMVSGKVDRAALLATTPPPPPARSTGRVAPQPGLQQTIADIWSRVLSVPDIGATDNFFDLGGHSLLLTRAQTALQRELGHAVPVTDLFTHATVASLAEHLSGRATGSGALDILLPIRPHADTPGTEPPLFCVHPASGLAWPFAGLRKHIRAEVPIYGIQARGLTAPSPVPATLDEMVGEYLDQIRAVAPHGPYRLIGWSFGGVVAHALATRLRAAGEPVELLGMLDSYPAYPWDKLAADHEQQALRSLLYMAHYDLEQLPDHPLDRATVLRTVAAQGGVLAGLTEDTITAVMDTFVNSAPLQQNSAHTVFDGDLLFCTATVNPVDPTLSARDWAPYIGGTIANLDIACEHKDMTQAGPLAVIGRTLDARLSTP